MKVGKAFAFAFLYVLFVQNSSEASRVKCPNVLDRLTLRIIKTTELRKWAARYGFSDQLLQNPQIFKFSKRDLSSMTLPKEMNFADLESGSSIILENYFIFKRKSEKDKTVRTYLRLKDGVLIYTEKWWNQDHLSKSFIVEMPIHKYKDTIEISSLELKEVEQGQVTLFSQLDLDTPILITNGKMQVIKPSNN